MLWSTLLPCIREFRHHHPLPGLSTSPVLHLGQLCSPSPCAPQTDLVVCRPSALSSWPSRVDGVLVCMVWYPRCVPVCSSLLPRRVPPSSIPTSKLLSIRICYHERWHLPLHAITIPVPRLTSHLPVPSSSILAQADLRCSILVITVPDTRFNQAPDSRMIATQPQCTNTNLYLHL